ncbi:MAG: DUF1365 domain-containing protein [Gammaproteobacteria bacterium]|nr:DUF1365 domain-containing protein [Gammaproteobacteria bacterium]
MSELPADLQLFQGWVDHDRRQPRAHRFRYRISPVWLNVQQTSVLDKLSWLWSSRRPAAVRFDRDKFLPGAGSVYQSAQQEVLQHNGQQFEGTVYLLANLSVWGICYNPVSFYFCYNAAGQLRYILSEIHNTPWGERHVYVHEMPAGAELPHQGRFEFDKQFHVSPFMPMDLHYDWSFRVTNDNIFVTMRLLRADQKIFKVSMDLTARPLTAVQALWLPFRYPLMCVKVFTAIYWQAFILWCKRVPFYNHP